ncbi:MAG TPA: hypothetical protein VGG85_03575 [Terracidiphilus sp.]
MASQTSSSNAAAVPAPASAAPMRTDFHVRYINGTNVYIDGGTSSGLAEGVELILKQDTSMSEHDPANAALEPGVIAKLKVVSAASTSAVCEVVATKRELTVKDVVSLPDSEVKNLVDKDALGKSRQFPMVISFTEGDPLDEEVRDQVPRPPLPEVNEARGRIGFDVSTIQQLGQGSAASSEYGMVFRADFTRLLGTHWNLNGYWRGTLQHNAAAQASIQDLMNRTYLMSFSYINPNSPWTASIGRMYLPWASSLETIDGAYVGRMLSPKTTLGVFAGSTPDPTAWNYDPQRRIGGSFFNLHGGDYESFHYSTTVGAGVELLKWKIDRPFIFTENDFSFKRYFSLYHSMQLDKPTANPGMPAVSPGLGQSLLSLRMQVHPRLTLDVTDTYFRDVPTYEATLVGTGLLDKYLYQGINGGARIQLPLHLIGYFSLGNSSNSNDKKQSLNEQIGATLARIWKTGMQVDARYSKFDSSFASGTYRTLSISRDLGERLRANIQGGRYTYSSSLASANDSIFINALFDMNLGARLFLQSAFTTQRGGPMDYNQWTTTLGYRFDNRAAMRKAAAQAKQP